MKVAKKVVLAVLVGLTFFWARVGLDAIYLHLHRDETSFPPSFAVHFALQQWLWFLVPAALSLATAIAVQKLRSRSQPPSAAA